MEERADHANRFLRHLMNAGIHLSVEFHCVTIDSLWNANYFLRKRMGGRAVDCPVLVWRYASLQLGPDLIDYCLLRQSFFRERSGSCHHFRPLTYYFV